MNDFLQTKKENLMSPQILDVATLDRYIAAPPRGSVVVRVTPEIAEHALTETNHKNRPISSSKIVSYSNDMRSKNWSLTGETIKFGNDGLLKDGQHRLYACVRANTHFDTHCIFGIHAETFQHIDIGKRRGGADTLAMMGVPNSRVAATIIKMIIAYENGLSESPKAGVSNDWIKEKYNSEIDHELLQEAIALASRVYKITKWQTGVVGAFFYVAVQKGQRDQVSPFFDDFVKGIGKSARAPIPYLLAQVNRMRTDRTMLLRAHQLSILLSRTYRNYKAGRLSNLADVTVSLDDKMVAF
tara:strand:- start:393 stop:1289 length:897 start_codon:yes stop_codon:yes gene_type:complete